MRVTVFGPAFYVEVSFERFVEVWSPFKVKPKEMDPLLGFASTWDSGSIGTHGNSAAFILSGVSRHTDRFIDEYLRVNADAC